MAATYMYIYIVCTCIVCTCICVHNTLDSEAKKQLFALNLLRKGMHALFVVCMFALSLMLFSCAFDVF